MRVAVVGAGISGLAAAHVLATAGVEVALYEKEECLGGHAKTVSVDGVDVDLGFVVFNRVSSSSLPSARLPTSASIPSSFPTLTKHALSKRVALSPRTRRTHTGQYRPWALQCGQRCGFLWGFGFLREVKDERNVFSPVATRWLSS